MPASRNRDGQLREKERENIILLLFIILPASAFTNVEIAVTATTTKTKTCTHSYQKCMRCMCVYILHILRILMAYLKCHAQFHWNINFTNKLLFNMYTHACVLACARVYAVHRHVATQRVLMRTLLDNKQNAPAPAIRDPGPGINNQ